jgi:hypothetical protein
MIVKNCKHNHRLNNIKVGSSLHSLATLPNQPEAEAIYTLMTKVYIELFIRDKKGSM